MAAEGGLLALAFLLGAVLGIGPFQALRVDWSGAWGAAAGLGATGVAVGGWRYGSTWPPVRRFRDLVEELVQRAFGNAGLADLVIVSALAAIAEEALFRGVAQVAIARALDPWSAAAAAGLLFGVAHWLSFLYALYATLLGVVLGALFVAFDNLLAPVAAHFTYDLAALAYLVRMQGRD